MQELKPRISVEYLGKYTETHNIANGIVEDIFLSRYSLLVCRTMGRNGLHSMDGAMARPWNRVVARMVMLPMRRERESHILYRLPLPPPDVPGNVPNYAKRV